MLLLSSIVVSAAPAACPERTPAEELARAVEETEQALRDLDDQGFRDRFNVLAGLALPCAAELVDPGLAVRYHELMGLHLFAVGDAHNAALSVVAARRLDPEASIPDDLVSPDHELRRAWAEDDGRARYRRVPEPRSGSLAFDGIGGRDRPAGVPTLLQRFDESGLLASTTYLGAREPLPDYPAVPRTRAALVGSASAAGAASVVLFALAGVARGNLYDTAADPSAPAEELDRLRTLGNTWTALGTIGLVGGLGAGTAAILVGER